MGKPDIAVLRLKASSAHNSGAVKIWNNTIIAELIGYGTGTTVGALSAADEFKNNIVYCLPGATAYTFYDGDLSARFNIDYNDIFTGRSAATAYVKDVGKLSWAAWRDLGYDKHSINADPLFVNAATQDFRLRNTSPAMRAGVTLPLVATDYAGGAPF